MSAFAFDSLGRLWITTSGATDHAHDGVYLVRTRGAAPVKVVGGLKGPLGLTWVGNRLYVASLGRVDAFSGLRGTRFARRRLILAEPSGHSWNDSADPPAPACPRPWACSTSTRPPAPLRFAEKPLS
jgi:hypothetical protein